jgi:hypothetical protein
MSSARSSAAIQVDIDAVQAQILNAYQAAVRETTDERLWGVLALMVSNNKLILQSTCNDRFCD